MNNGFFSIPPIKNEPVRNYAPGSHERSALTAQIHAYKQHPVEVPMVIGGHDVKSDTQWPIRPPHDHKTVLGHCHQGNKTHVQQAIGAALNAQEKWEKVGWQARAAIFLKAADLLAGPYRQKINAASLLGQSKNAYQAEIDAACEMIDFLRFNVQYMTEIYAGQPLSAPETWNRMEYRPLEGFVFAITPFNFTSIAGNLPTSAAMMGNVVVWKPSDKQVFSAKVLMDVFVEAGVPPGVINMVFCEPHEASETVFSHPYFAGLHFTGSTQVFKNIWKTIAHHVDAYVSFPRIVGETGGKDFLIVHGSAHIAASVTALIRGAFEYQGQKCSAASRAYIAASVWPALKEKLLADLHAVKMGSPENFENFINAVIDETAFDRIVSYIEMAKGHSEAEIIAGGTYDKTDGYFITPTVIVTSNPYLVTMQEEIFGPVLTLYIYKDEEFEKTLALVNNTSRYALTGGILAQDREAIALAEEKLLHAAGNFYINDKCTGAVVGQQPFGGARLSGTNDKSGSMLNLLRWVSPRAIKENFNPPHHFGYPFMNQEAV